MLYIICVSIVIDKEKDKIICVLRRMTHITMKLHHNLVWGGGELALSLPRTCFKPILSLTCALVVQGWDLLRIKTLIFHLQIGLKTLSDSSRAWPISAETFLSMRPIFFLANFFSKHFPLQTFLSISFLLLDRQHVRAWERKYFFLSVYLSVCLPNVRHDFFKKRIGPTALPSERNVKATANTTEQLIVFTWDTLHACFFLLYFIMPTYWGGLCRAHTPPSK